MFEKLKKIFVRILIKIVSIFKCQSRCESNCMSNNNTTTYIDNTTGPIEDGDIYVDSVVKE